MEPAIINFHGDHSSAQRCGKKVTWVKSQWKYRAQMGMRLPDILHFDHGSDFTSRHLEQVAADLRIEVVFSGVGRPQGRGKIKRLFGTLNTELVPELPGYLVEGRPASAPVLSLSQLDAAVGAYIVSGVCA